jgi:hypothetical protein
MRSRSIPGVAVAVTLLLASPEAVWAEVGLRYGTECRLHLAETGGISGLRADDAGSRFPSVMLSLRGSPARTPTSLADDVRLVSYLHFGAPSPLAERAEPETHFLQQVAVGSAAGIFCSFWGAGIGVALIPKQECSGFACLGNLLTAIVAASVGGLVGSTLGTAAGVHMASDQEYRGSFGSALLGSTIGLGVGGLSGVAVGRASQSWLAGLATFLLTQSSTCALYYNFSLKRAARETADASLNDRGRAKSFSVRARILPDPYRSSAFMPGLEVVYAGF